MGNRHAYNSKNRKKQAIRKNAELKKYPHFERLEKPIKNVDNVDN